MRIDVRRQLGRNTKMSLWKLDQIQWQDFDATLVDPRFLRLAKGACLVEFNANDYVAYLSNVFRGDDDLCAEIRKWGDDERQHGTALARWVKLADPNFDFDKAVAKFRKVQPIEVDAQTSIRGSKCQELVARCMVETGTATYYAALCDSTVEPVFKQICKLIAADEIHHYKFFLKTLEKYKKLEGLSRWKRFKTVVERSVEAEDEELTLAFACGNYPDREIRREDFKEYSKEFLAIAYRLYRRPHIERASKLAVNAAGLPSKPWLTKSIAAVLTGIMHLRQRAIPEVLA